MCSEAAKYEQMVNLLCRKGTRFSNEEFWSIQTDMQRLSRLAKALYCIPASSAAVERFFSICGVVNNPRRMNTGDELFVQRSLLKANLWMLDDDERVRLTVDSEL